MAELADGADVGRAVGITPLPEVGEEEAAGHRLIVDGRIGRRHDLPWAHARPDRSAPIDWKDEARSEGFEPPTF